MSTLLGISTLVHAQGAVPGQENGIVPRQSERTNKVFMAATSGAGMFFLVPDRTQGPIPPCICLDAHAAGLLQIVPYLAGFVSLEAGNTPNFAGLMLDLTLGTGAFIGPFVILYAAFGYGAYVSPIYSGPGMLSIHAGMMMDFGIFGPGMRDFTLHLEARMGGVPDFLTVSGADMFVNFMLAAGYRFL